MAAVPKQALKAAASADSCCCVAWCLASSGSHLVVEGAAFASAKDDVAEMEHIEAPVLGGKMLDACIGLAADA